MSNLSSRGPSQRQLRVGELLRHRLSEVLLRGETHDPELDRASVTVSEVQVSPDLRHAKVFVLPLGGAETEATLAALARNSGTLRRQVVKGLNLKYAPAFKFVADKSFDRMDETRALLADEKVQRDLASGQGSHEPE